MYHVSWPVVNYAAGAPVSAKPANLLLEQPTKFGRIINLRMAKTIALTASQSLLLRPDEVIQ